MKRELAQRYYKFFKYLRIVGFISFILFLTVTAYNTGNPTLSLVSYVLMLVTFSCIMECCVLYCLYLYYRNK